MKRFVIMTVGKTHSGKTTFAKELENELKKQSGKNLPVNVDGAIAAVFCAFGWEPRLAKALFITARVPGLCGQFLNNF